MDCRLYEEKKKKRNGEEVKKIKEMEKK